ncbi:MAG: bifunctional DNA-binding transcriptional regulator/O6-methylguanine-DNA methyltransferase Ada, partial [Gammaproteobacteria bacterium]
MSSAAQREISAAAADPRWQAILDRNPEADGSFYYSVSTTGIYCRPSCGSRRANRKNVAFHDSAAAAEQAGFRACKRCKPDQASLAERNTALITDACRLIDTAESPPTLDELAACFNTSTYHFHRLFKSITGLTPRQYASANRERRVRERLTEATSVTDAIYAAGYNSNSRFYANADQVLGMTPTEFRAGGSNAAIRFAVGECSLGSILVACSERGVCAILIGDDPDALARELQDQFPQALLLGGDENFAALVARVVGFVEAPSIGLDLPLDVRGTAFQRRVWEALRNIPFGETA